MLWGRPPVASYATSGPNTYSVFLHGDFPLLHVQTGNNTGRKIMIIKESFGNAFAPFLVSHYDDVYIVDQRYFELGVEDFVREDIFLALPTKFLCREDCKGLCPQCGKNLNDGSCSCKKPVDPRLAVLQQLLDKEE